jgi:hypothetical protein
MLDPSQFDTGGTSVQTCQHHTSIGANSTGQLPKREFYHAPRDHSILPHVIPLRFVTAERFEEYTTNFCETSIHLEYGNHPLAAWIDTSPKSPESHRLPHISLLGVRSSQSWTLMS